MCRRIYILFIEKPLKIGVNNNNRESQKSLHVKKFSSDWLIIDCHIIADP